LKEETEVEENKEENKEENIDPRWDKIKATINDDKYSKMAHPKRKISKTRRDKENTLQSYSNKCYCPINYSEAHLYHRAYAWGRNENGTEGKLL
jgi:hypothetical protein